MKVALPRGFGMRLFYFVVMAAVDIELARKIVLSTGCSKKFDIISQADI